MTVRASRGSRGLPQEKITRGDASYYACRAIRRLVEETNGFAGMAAPEIVERIRQEMARNETFGE